MLWPAQNLPETNYKDQRKLKLTNFFRFLNRFNHALCRTRSKRKINTIKYDTANNYVTIWRAMNYPKIWGNDPKRWKGLENDRFSNPNCELQIITPPCQNRKGKWKQLVTELLKILSPFLSNRKETRTTKRAYKLQIYSSLSTRPSDFNQGRKTKLLNTRLEHALQVSLWI